MVFYRDYPYPVAAAAVDRTEVVALDTMTIVVDAVRTKVDAAFVVVVHTEEAPKTLVVHKAVRIDHRRSVAVDLVLCCFLRESCTPPEAVIDYYPATVEVTTSSRLLDSARNRCWLRSYQINPQQSLWPNPKNLFCPPQPWKHRCQLAAARLEEEATIRYFRNRQTYFSTLNSRLLLPYSSLPRFFGI